MRRYIVTLNPGFGPAWLITDTVTGREYSAHNREDADDLAHGRISIPELNRRNADTDPV